MHGTSSLRDDPRPSWSQRVSVLDFTQKMEFLFSILVLAFFLFFSLPSCRYEKDLSFHENFSLLLNKRFTLRGTVFIVENSLLEFPILALPQIRGLPSVKSYLDMGSQPNK